MPKIKAARVVEVAAVAVQAAVREVAAWAAVDLPAAKAVAEVDAQVVAAADKVAADKVAADKVAAAVAVQVVAVVDRVVVAVDVPPAVVAADKVVVVEDVLPAVAAAVKVVEEVAADLEVELAAVKAVVEREAEEVAVVAPAVAGAAGIVNSSRSTGRQNWRPVFVFFPRHRQVAAVVHWYLRTKLLTPRARSVAVDS